MRKEPKRLGMAHLGGLMPKNEPEKRREGQAQSEHLSLEGGAPDLTSHELSAPELKKLSNEEFRRIFHEADDKGSIPPEIMAEAESRLGFPPEIEAAFRALGKQRMAEAQKEHGEVFSDADMERIRQRAESARAADGQDTRDLTPEQIGAFKVLREQRIEEARAKHGQVFTAEDVRRMMKEVDDERKDKGNG